MRLYNNSGQSSVVVTLVCKVLQSGIAQVKDSVLNLECLELYVKVKQFIINVKKYSAHNVHSPNTDKGQRMAERGKR